MMRTFYWGIKKNAWCTFKRVKRVTPLKRLGKLGKGLFSLPRGIEMAMPTDCIYKGEQHEHAYAQPWTESERTCDVSVQPLRKGALLFKDSCLRKWIAVLENIVSFSKLK